VTIALPTRAKVNVVTESTGEWKRNASTVYPVLEEFLGDYFALFLDFALDLFEEHVWIIPRGGFFAK
jgi:hypothetical protein